jgi:hypothetical protein
MADKKISALTGATTPLAGTEVLPIVQSGTTVKVAVSNLTSGRAVDMLSLVADTTTLVADSTNHRTGVGTATPSKKLNVVIDAVASRQNLDAVDRTSQNLLTVTNPQYSTDASMGMMFRSFPQSDARQGAGFFASGGGSNNTTDFNLFVSGLGGADVSYSAVSIDGNAGDATVRKGNLVIGTSGKGIDFSATAGTGTSELLADYEEGNWTPGLSFNNGTTSLTYTSQVGTYIKVGRQVTVFGYILLSNKGSSTGVARLTGLPFTTTTTSTAGTLSFNYIDSVLAFTGAVWSVESNTTVGVLRLLSAITVTNGADTNFTNTSTLYFSGTYTAAS